MVEDLHTASVTVKLLCDTVEVSKSGYYAWTKRPASATKALSSIPRPQNTKVPKSRDGRLMGRAVLQEPGPGARDNLILQGSGS